MWLKKLYQSMWEENSLIRVGLALIKPFTDVASINMISLPHEKTPHHVHLNQVE